MRWNALSRQVQLTRCTHYFYTYYVRDSFRLSHEELNNSIYDINGLFTRIMESGDSNIINATADFLDKAFYKRERLLL